MAQRTVRTLFPPLDTQGVELSRSAVAVIDVLRASTTICQALHNGAGKIFPAGSEGQALSLGEKIKASGRKVLIGGERAGYKIAGFDLGNSPLEYTRRATAGADIVLLTTNGTRALGQVCDAHRVFIGCFQNLSAVIKRLGQERGDIFLVACGKEGRFCLEDAVCCGAIVDGLIYNCTPDELNVSDASIAARYLYHACRRWISKMLRECEHGRYLISIGFGDDVDFCARQDILPIVPYLSEGALVKD